VSKTKRSKGPLEGETFIANTLSMRQSIAWSHLPNNARRVLDRLEREHAQHGGAENGRLRCTYKDFEEAGIPEKGIALAIRQCVALGFLEITFRAQPSVSAFRRSNEYRLTSVPSRGGKPPMTHDWRLVTSDEQALSRLSGAATARSDLHEARAKQAALPRTRAAA
jgi:hypothetical protein